jgi:hypothetical protein
MEIEKTQKVEKGKKGKKGSLNDDETITKMMKRARENLTDDNTNFPIRNNDLKYLDELDFSDISGIFQLKI